MDEKSLDNKVALVTGASRGLGKAVAVRLASCGAKVAINYLSSSDEANKVSREIEALGGQTMLCGADVADARAVREMTRQVVSNNFKFTKASDPVFRDRRDSPLPLHPGEKDTPIKHIVFISKENRTYDEVFGQIEKGKGDPALARYGAGASFKNRARTDSVTRAA